MSNNCNVKIGDVVWRLLDPHDGGGVAPQIGWVEEIHEDYVVIKFYTGNVVMKFSEYGTHWSKNENELSYVYHMKF